MPAIFRSKDEARQAVWDTLTERRAARFPFPVRGRIPNFAGAREAAERLGTLPALQRARRIKVNPDAPQRPVREWALRNGVTVFMPTPRLKAGFRRLDPARIPADRLAEAAGLKRSARWAEEVPLSELPRMDFVITGSVAVTRRGRRCGKGHGYGDLEYAVLRELGHPPVPVGTTVHPLQIVEDFPPDPHDLPLGVVATPEELIEIPDPPPEPGGIDWSLITGERLDEMPVLRELHRLV